MLNIDRRPCHIHALADPDTSDLFRHSDIQIYQLPDRMHERRKEHPGAANRPRENSSVRTPGRFLPCLRLVVQIDHYH